MFRQLDHVVIAVHDLVKAAVDYRALGFNVIDGGEHADGRSHNLLIAFQDGAYIEIIAFKESLAGTKHRWAHALDHGEGFVTYAIRVENLDQEIARLRTSGLAFDDPIDGGRVRPDGRPIAWRSGRAPSVSGSLFPFIIEDVTDHGLRVPSGDDAIHPNGATGIAGVREIVADLDAAAPARRALLDAGQGDAAAAPVRLPLGSAWLELISPANGPEDARTYFNERGAGPYEIILSAATGSSAERLLSLNLTHGARIWIAG